jgi:penicillin-binding protein 1A
MKDDERIEGVAGAAEAAKQADGKRGAPAKGAEKKKEKDEETTASPETKPARETKWRRARRVAWKWTKRASLASAVVVLAATIAACVIVRRIEADLPSVADLKSHYTPSQVTRVLARDGTLLAELFTERRTVVSIHSLPAHVKLAVLAAEDASFYEHEGLNYFGIARAFLINLRSGKTKQGGSTITQQVVKNLLLDSERTYKRKLKEALLARKLEQELTKDEILELYLNHIYFGHGRYGIEEAARDNFAKPAKDVTIAEAALLAGLVAGPESFSPRKDLKKSLARRAFVLEQMKTKGFLNQAQYDAAMEEPVRLAPSVEARSELAPEAVEIAKRMLHDLEPERAKKGGFTITTTIDPRLQAAARKAVRDALAAYDKRHNLAGPLKGPLVATVDKKGRTVPPPPPKEPAYEGTPSFESHKVYVGVVVATDDVQGTIDVRVGTVLGSVKLADYERYNPGKLAPSAFAPVGAHLRVSLLAPVPNVGAGAQAKGEPLAAATKVPLRMEAGPEAALVALDVRSRQVLALVGNYEALTGGLDRATQSRRQPGSTFKPIVYSYAIHSRHYTPATLVDPTPTTFAGNYKPSNYEGWTGTDLLRLRDALANSVNVVAVRVLDDLGPSNVVSWAQSLGIRSTLKPDLSLALGSYEVTPLELAGAYATFAAGGVYEEPRIVTRIVGPDGKDVELKPTPPSRRVLDEPEDYVLTSMLTSVVAYGTGAKAKALGRPVAGKTGTSNQSKDTWFSGYSTDVTATVWVGYDDGRPLGAGETGGVTAIPAWIDFMKAAHANKPPSAFPKPVGVSVVTIDKKTGKLPSSPDAETIEEVFLAGTEPTEPADVANGDGGGQDAER